MTDLSLNDAWAKLRWATRHFESLRPRVETIEQSDNHIISVSIDVDTGQYTFYVDGLQPLDGDFGLYIGDCLHNARTALDYLMVRLVAKMSGKTPTRD